MSLNRIPNPQDDKPIVAVILAAGGSSRFEGVKQIAQLNVNHSILASTIEVIKTVQLRFNQSAVNLVDDNHHLLEQANIATLSALTLAKVAVVLGANQQQIMTDELSSIMLEQVEVVVNHQWQQGLATSIHSAVHYALEQQACGLMLILADQVALTADHYLTLLQSFVTQNQTTSAFYQQSVGVPAIFLAQDFEQLLALTGDSGAKKILKKRQQSHRLVCIDLPQASIDIDTRADLTRFLATQE
ncbi:nucleotidyltransferase family protein [Shewanella sp. OMA3-2]|uniref:nucleotidyltransferase family protein n=1 Tax=Shewanella sp. OMA3-2 TaxID=2908650 RepID=UPI001F22FCC0|nr:nucleotidyltransferase family protein [Shewanella sp. OMA3-2]UJF20459.1 nucleotidyltransferase family protein [Shewanella sp. OMA3-2]